MKELIKKILKESIPVYTQQTPYKKVWSKFRKSFPNTPEYVLRDFFEATFIQSPKNMEELIYRYYGEPKAMLSQYWIKFLEGPWKLQILKLNPEDFTDKTINSFLERDFGNEDTYLVKNDKQRTLKQRELVKTDGTNEPVILVKQNNKYELIEGWHRTMSMLLKGDNGEDLKNWNKVKIRAWVTEV